MLSYKWGKQDGYYWTKYYYAPGKYHHAYYYPNKPGRYAYYYNYKKQRYWGRFDYDNPGKYSLLGKEERKKDLDDIVKFPEPKPLEEVSIPGEDGNTDLKMTAPPPLPDDR